jgi:hypothetical protein
MNVAVYATITVQYDHSGNVLTHLLIGSLTVTLVVYTILIYSVMTVAMEPVDFQHLNVILYEVTTLRVEFLFLWAQQEYVRVHFVRIPRSNDLIVNPTSCPCNRLWRRIRW